MPTIAGGSGGRIETNDMQGARKLSEHVEAASRAVQQVRESLRALADLAEYDPQRVFSHTVREHREAINITEGLLRDLCFDGQDIESAAAGAGLGKEAITVIRATHVRLRVLRALAYLLSGDRRAFDEETAEVRSQVESAIKTRASSGESWTKEEREAMGGRARPFSSGFEALLNGS